MRLKSPVGVSEGPRYGAGPRGIPTDPAVRVAKSVQLLNRSATRYGIRGDQATARQFREAALRIACDAMHRGY